MNIRFEISFRTIRIGSLKTFPPRNSRKCRFKLTKDELKFNVVLEQSQTKDNAIKVVIPTSSIIFIEGHVMRGCPVIWITTDNAMSKKIRRLCEMRILPYPTPYFDPDSNELANRRIAVIPVDDPINNQDLAKFQTVIRYIADKRKMLPNDFFKEISRVVCNEQLVHCTRYISELTKLLKIKQEIKSEPFPEAEVYTKIVSDAEDDEYVILVQSSDEDEDLETQSSSVKSAYEISSKVQENEAVSGIPSSNVVPLSQLKIKTVSPADHALNLDSNSDDIPLSELKIKTISSSEPMSKLDSNPESEISPVPKTLSNAANMVASKMNTGQLVESKRKIDHLMAPEVIPKRKKMFGDFENDEAAATSEIDKSQQVDESVTASSPLQENTLSSNTVPGIKRVSVPSQSPLLTENAPKNQPSAIFGNSSSDKSDVKTIRGTASLSCNMQTLHQDMESMLGDTPLCTCTVKSQYILNSSHKITCMAIDNIDGHLTGCVNLVGEQHMMRSSKNLPIHGICAAHRDRMMEHECCPGCGTFCTGGTFLVCNGTAEHQHRFHRNCLVLTRHTMDCPHCGSPMSNILEVTMEPHPEYLKKYEENIREVVEVSPDKKKRPSYPDCVVRIPGVTKPVPENMLLKRRTTFMPEREGLDLMLSSIEMELPKKLRFQAKSLIQLVKQGDVAKVSQLLCGTSGDPNARNPGNLRTALHEAVARGNLQVMHVLITAGADVNSQDDDGKTPLFYAEEQGRHDMMKYLLTCNASLTHGDCEGMIPLHHAAKQGRLESCLLLLNYRSQSQHINCRDEGGWTPFVWAAEHSRVNTARCLVYYDVHMQSVDEEGNVCLQWAALSGDKNILLMCLRKNCNVNHQNVLGDTALHIAAREDNYECVITLLAWGADPCIENKERKLPSQCAKEPSLCQVALLMSVATRNAICDHKGFEPFDRERVLSADISRGKEKIEISCVNAVDEAPCPVTPPHEFLYISKNIYKYTNVNAIMSKIKSCKCTSECLTSCCCGMQSEQCWYDISGKLLPSFNYKNPPRIYECNPLCKCSITCRNRVIQKGGVRFRIQVYRTSNIGWGVRALEPILKGSFVCEYIGEVIQDGDARPDDFYLFDLDEKPGGAFCIDGRSYGNVSRYINHHCEPNLVPVRFFYDHQDENFPRIAFFAARNISIREQLSFDYGDGFWDEKSATLTCECGATNCRYSEQAYRRMRKIMEIEMEED